MTAEAEGRAQRIAEEALKRLTEELQAGKSEALRAYLAAMGRFHRYMRAPAHAEHGFRLKLNADSGGS